MGAPRAASQSGWPVWRRLLAILALLILLAPGALVRDSIGPKNDSQAIVATSLPPLTPEARKSIAGPLRYVAGWELESANSDFGGYSALAVTDNRRFLALSDAGSLAGFTLPPDAVPVLAGQATSRSFVAALPSPGDRSVRKEDRDSEGMTHDPASGRFWISYEHNHAIRRFAPSFSRLEAVTRPAAMRDWPINGGAETIVRLVDGRFLVLAEVASGPDGSTQGLLFSSDPTDPDAQLLRFGYRAPAGYRATDAAQLPDGRLLVLNRRFSIFEGVSAKVTIIDPANIKTDSVLAGRVLLTLKSPFPVDNMEGIAVRHAHGQTSVWIISDDNYAPFQRTLLLQFEWLPGRETDRTQRFPPNAGPKPRSANQAAAAAF